MTARSHDPHIGLVVEGRGDVNAAPLLLRKWQNQKLGDYREILGKPVDCGGQGNAIKRDGIEGYVATAAARPGCVAVLVILDAEQERACELGPKMLERATRITEKRVEVCLAETCWEDWIYASIETMELGDIPYQSEKHGGPIIKHALYPAKYVKPTWQPRLTAKMDIELAMGRSASLARLLRKFELLIELL